MQADWRALGVALAIVLLAVVLLALTQRTDFEEGWEIHPQAVEVPGH